ncbi:hypothetical protein NPIL_443061, partial [Nephila pilipes]
MLGSLKIDSLILKTNNNWTLTLADNGFASNYRQAQVALLHHQVFL